ncbi:hypothetical protein Leryth_001777 [Lithospermum erythrorhizon]|nr:hypothetical protein Leryth_001777 [Lithospermum erythrorhizon]
MQSLRWLFPISLRLHLPRVMNLSYNNLSGRIPSGPQLQTIPNASYMGNDGLCGFPLSKSCGNHESPQHSLPDEEDDREFFDGFTWQS